MRMCWPLGAALFAAPVASVAAAFAPVPSTVTVAIAQTGTLTENVELTGDFVARDEAMVTPQVDGLAVTAILADEGDHVARGQVLGRLSSAAIEASIAENVAKQQRDVASVAQARQQITEAAATAAEARSAFARAQDLLGRGDLARETFDQKRAASEIADNQVAAAADGLSIAQADLAAARGEHDGLMVRLAQTELRAPVSGVISRRVARLGAVVGTASDPLFRIIADDKVEMEAEVPTTALARLRLGEAARIETQEGEVDGHVRLLSPEVADGTKLGRVRIAFDEPVVPPLVGSFARATIAVARRSGTLVPMSAVMFDPGGDAALDTVVGSAPAERVRTIRVAIGLVADGRAEVDRGLAPGTRVVALAGTFLHDGDEVAAVLPSVDAER